MKKLISALLCLACLLMVGCKDEVVNQMPPTDDSPSGPINTDIPSEAITVKQAIQIAQQYESPEKSLKRYFVRGYVVGFDASQHDMPDFDTKFAEYGSEYIFLKDTKDSLHYTEPSDDTFHAYRLLGRYGNKLPDRECIKEGDYVVISCFITTYKNSKRSIWESVYPGVFLYSSSNPHFNEVCPKFKGFPIPNKGEISISEAELITAEMEPKAVTTEEYNVRGVITEIPSQNTSFGSLNFNISDGLTYGTCYQTYYKKTMGKFTDVNQISVGDTVLIHAPLQNYNNICEPYRGYIVESTNPNF